MEQPDAMYMDYYYDIKRRLEHYPRISAVVYLQTDPAVAHDRLLERARSAESGTPLAYLEDLHRFHEACLPQICREMQTPMLTVNWNAFGCEHELAKMIFTTIEDNQPLAA